MDLVHLRVEMSRVNMFLTTIFLTLLDPFKSVTETVSRFLMSYGYQRINLGDTVVVKSHKGEKFEIVKVYWLWRWLYIGEVTARVTKWTRSDWTVTRFRFDLESYGTPGYLPKQGESWKRTRTRWFSGNDGQITEWHRIL